MRYLVFILLAVAFTACKKPSATVADKPIAKVFDKYLYERNVKGVVPVGVSGQDSIALVKDFIDKWIRNELLLNKAELNLTDEEKNVEKQIENYRSSLLIYTYQQVFLNDKLDTVVSDAEIETYFKENQSNFILGEPLMKGVFVKVPVNAPELYKLRQWYQSDDPASIKNLEEYCFKHASVYDHFNENWVNLNEILRMMPPNTASFVSGIQYRKSLEARDAQYIYFLHVKEFAPEGTVSPIELVKNDIHNIILNKRKIKLISELEQNIFSDAQNRNNFTIY